MPDWLHQAVQALKPFLPKGFVGQVEINIKPDGGISHINVKQSFRPEGKR